MRFRTSHCQTACHRAGLDGAVGGTYFCRLQSNGSVETRSELLIKQGNGKSGSSQGNVRDLLSIPGLSQGLKLLGSR
jgi:hypothetical protein